MPRELLGVNAEFISLVRKGANKQQLALYKSADVHKEDEEPTQGGSDGLVEKIVKAVKNVLVKEDQKITFTDKMKRETAYSNLWDSFDVMRDVMYDILWWSTSDTPKADLEVELESFKQFVLSTVTDLGIKKSAELLKADKNKVEVLKSETGLQPEKVAKFEDGLKELTNMLSEIKKSNKNVGEEEEMDTEKLVKAIGDALAPIVKSMEGLSENINSINSKVEELEKGTQAVAGKANEAVEKTEEVKTQVEKSAEELIKSALDPVIKAVDAVSESMKEVSAKVQKMEAFRVTSNAGDGAETKVEKSTDSGSFQNLFSGLRR